ncbi:MAG: hypothetical protein KF862_05150 [Chitinophagaceae bacterium]|nr:hypothetical protein [Chitinophagaceae bacterium]
MVRVPLSCILAEIKYFNLSALEESISYISANPNALSNEIPLELLELWLEKEAENEESENRLAYSVFMYVLLKYNDRKGISKFDATTDGFIDIYKSWQVTINMVYLDRMSEFKITPLKIFDFSIYKNLKFEIKVKSDSILNKLSN